MDMTRRILVKMASRCRIGWVDFSSDSYDFKVASARATRIRLRCRGIRLSLKEALS